MLALRLAYTAAVMVAVVWLLRAGNPLAGLLIVPILAVSLRQAAESGRLARFARDHASAFRK
jgi:uncharacterized membrane protein